MVVSSTGEHLQLAIVVLIACFLAISIKRQVVIYIHERVLGRAIVFSSYDLAYILIPNASLHFLMVMYVNSSLSVLLYHVTFSTPSHC